ncbi:MAG TPA: four helix bundle protein [Bacteroidota bacterium]|nr:four helix bundle protein [Bacteroidota bacterium]
MKSRTTLSSSVPKVRDYRDLLVWQRSITLVTKVYNIAESFPKRELFGLTSQLHRAAVSVPSNIAEGQQRRSAGEFKRFLSIALGSLGEVDTQLFVARELKYFDSETLNDARTDICEIRKMISGLIASLEMQLGNRS